MQQRHVGPPVPQQPLLLGRPAEQDLDANRLGLRGVRVEQLRQQLDRGAGLGGQHQPGCAVGGAGSPGTAFCGRGQGDTAARAVEQGDPEASLEQLNGTGERRLGDPQPFSGPAEVQFFGHGDEVAQLSDLHDVHGSAPVGADTG